MAQSATTCTPPNPTPPTNMACNGVTGPNPPNYTKTSYANPFNMDANGRPQSPYGVNPSPPPYFDDAAGGVAGSGPAWGGPATTLPALMANTAALAGGTGATSGGTEGTYPGTGTGVSGVGAVPASTSVANEAAGTEVVVQKVQGTGAGDYNPAVFLPYTGAAAPTTAGATGTWQMITCSVLGNFTGTANPPNTSHASSLSPAALPTLTTATPSTASGTGTATVTATGTGFTRQSVVWVNGVAAPTTFVSSTSLTAVAPKKATAGTLPVNVVTGGVVTTASQNWTFT